GQVANNPDGSVAGVGDWRRQAEKVYENIGHLLRAAGATPASVVKETTWALSIDSWRQHGPPVRRAFYSGDFPASPLVEIPGLARRPEGRHEDHHLHHEDRGCPRRGGGARRGVPGGTPGQYLDRGQEPLPSGFLDRGRGRGRRVIAPEGGADAGGRTGWSIQTFASS